MIVTLKIYLNKYIYSVYIEKLKLVIKKLTHPNIVLAPPNEQVQFSGDFLNH